MVSLSSVGVVWPAGRREEGGPVSDIDFYTLSSHVSAQVSESNTEIPGRTLPPPHSPSVDPGLARIF